MTDSDPDVRWMTYAEAAAALRVNPESVAKRMRRGNWGRRMGNDGKPRVAVPVSVLPPSPPVPAFASATVLDTVPDNGNSEKPSALPVPDKGLADAVVAFREVEAQLRAERDAAQAEAATQRSRADRAEGEVDGLKTAAEHLQEVAAQARRDAAAAQGQVAEAVRRAEEADRKVVEARQEVERLRARGLLARLRNRP
jgi:hypothetical protein